MQGIRKIFTPFKGEISSKSRHTRIKIPQPIRTRASVRGETALEREELRSKPDWMKIHVRGVYRPDYGWDPLEKRAVPRTQVLGTLPERIVYKWLVDKMHMQEGYYEYVTTDFDFQGSMSGGRAELGGIVCDFLLPRLKIVINVNGPTHEQFLRHRKDEEQKDILVDMGYEVYDIDDDEIYDEMRFEDRMRKIFNLASGGGASAGMTDDSDLTNEDSDSVKLAQEILKLVQDTNAMLFDVGRGLL